MTNEATRTDPAALRRADPAQTETDRCGITLTTAACELVGKLLYGEGWTTALTLDDAYAAELVQTWSLPGDDTNGESAKADGRITDPCGAPLLT